MWNHSWITIGYSFCLESGQSFPLYNTSQFKCTWKNKMSEGHAKMTNKRNFWILKYDHFERTLVYRLHALVYTNKNNSKVIISSVNKKPCSIWNAYTILKPKIGYTR